MTSDSAARSVVYAARVAVTAVEPREGDHYVLSLRESRIAAAARPGQFINLIQPDSQMMLRRPFSIHRVAGDTVCALVKVVGHGTRVFRGCKPGELIDVMGPIGNGFDIEGEPVPAFIVGGGTGAAVLPFLAERLVRQGRQVTAFAGFEHDVPLDMQLRPDGMNELTELAAIGADSLVATMQPRDGCCTGFVTDLLAERLKARRNAALVLACGPRPMLERVAELAAEAGIPCQVSMEERMGCGIGACAGCACRILVDGQPAYKRVCVDGPVFNAADVIW